VTGESPLPQGSGRTAAGVHALAQVASFNLRAPIPPENLRRALNRTLPPSIRVSEAKTVRSTTFHARHSAIAKTYEYRILRAVDCPPFLAHYVHVCPWPLSLDALKACAHVFVGEHDFLSFAATDPDQSHRNLSEEEEPEDRNLPGDLTRDMTPGALPNAGKTGTIRKVFTSAWEQRSTDAGELLIYRIRGDGFLHHMVRNLVGTMIDVGRGQLAPKEIPRILAARSRSEAGPTAPARGLFLHSVEYPTES
jgi:tRNA pseudouridine38-40 synthase